jgi:hypothetical protein
MQAIVKSDDTFLRLRELPGTDQRIIAHLKDGATVDIAGEPQNDAKGRAWYPVAIHLSNDALYEDEALTRPFVVDSLGWVAGWLIELQGESRPAVDFSVSRDTVESGQEVGVQWLAKGIEAIYLNDQPEIGDDHGEPVVRKFRPLTTTTYRLKVVYRDGGTDVFERTVTVNPISATTTPWTIDYYANESLTGAPALSVKSDTIDFEWGDGSPGRGVPSDKFSLRATRTWVAPVAGTYLFRIESDDGARLIVDGQSIPELDHWIEQPRTDFIAYVDLAAGAHTLTAEYFEHGGLAILHVQEPVKATRPSGPSIPTIKPRLGVHTIESAEAALDAEARGCNFFMVMDQTDVARAIKARHPDAVVVLRRYISDWTLGGAAYADRIGGADDGIWYEMYNEQDNWPYGTVDQIRNRIDQELTCANILLSRGAQVLLGGYSMGCPDYWNPAIVAQLKRYVPYYNGNRKVGVSCHNYSPTVAHLYSKDALIWYERRWENLFTKVGLDPTLRKLFLTETGVDNGGGMADNHVSDEDQVTWFKTWIDVQAQPVLVNGINYPSPVVGGAIFQYDMGKDAKWAGFRFNIESLRKAAW